MPVTDGILKAILPKEWRKFVLENAHSSTKDRGHLKKNTRKKLRLVSWYPMIKEIQEYVEFCPQCQLRTKTFNEFHYNQQKKRSISENGRRFMWANSYYCKREQIY